MDNSDIILSIIILIGYIACFGLGWYSSILYNFKSMQSKINYWRRNYIERYTEYRQLREFYAPRFDIRNSRWRCPRTGKFVPESDVIQNLKDDLGT